MAWSIKGDVKRILLLRPEGGDFRDIQPPLSCGRRWSGVVPLDWFCVVPSQQLHLRLVATAPIGSETEQALRLYGVNHGSI
jgi:hypothetical protein